MSENTPRGHGAGQVSGQRPGDRRPNDGVAVAVCYAVLILSALYLLAQIVRWIFWL